MTAETNTNGLHIVTGGQTVCAADLDRYVNKLTTVDTDELGGPLYAPAAVWKARQARSSSVSSSMTD